MFEKRILSCISFLVVTLTTLGVGHDVIGEQRPDSGDSATQKVAAQKVAERTINSLRPDRVLREFLGNPRLEGSVKDDLNDDAMLLDATRWNSAVAGVADHYSVTFSEAELSRLSKFLESSVGQKYLQSNAKVAARLLVHASNSRKQARAESQFEANLKTVLQNANAKARQVVESAMRQPKVDATSLAGRWFNHENVQGEYQWVGWHEKSRDGTNLSVGSYIDHSAKTFERFAESGIWRVKGRVVVEVNFSAPEEPNLFIVDELSKEKLVWRLVELSTDPSEWTSAVEERNEIPLLQLPAGYKQIDN